jgi:hypothetical protein
MRSSGSGLIFAVSTIKSGVTKLQATRYETQVYLLPPRCNDTRHRSRQYCLPMDTGECRLKVMHFQADTDIASPGIQSTLSTHREFELHAGQLSSRYHHSFPKSLFDGDLFKSLHAIVFSAHPKLAQCYVDAARKVRASLLLMGFLL